MYCVKVVQTNKHQVVSGSSGGGSSSGSSSSSSTSSSIFYRTITAVTKIPTNIQNCITEEVPYVTPIYNSARLPTTK